MTPEQQQMMAAAIARSGQPLQQPFQMNPYAAGASPFTPRGAEPTPVVDPRYAKAAQKYTTQSDALKAQRLQAAALAEKAGEAPSIIQAGNQVVAGANPLSALSQGIDSWSAMKMGQNVDADAATLAAKEDESAAAAGAIAQQLDEEKRAADIEAQNLARDKFGLEKEVAAETTALNKTKEARERAKEARAVAKAQKELEKVETLTTKPMIDSEGNTIETYVTADGIWTPGPDGKALRVDQTEFRPIPKKGEQNNVIPVNDTERYAKGIDETTRKLIAELPNAQGTLLRNYATAYSAADEAMSLANQVLEKNGSWTSPRETLVTSAAGILPEWAEKGARQGLKKIAYTPEERRVRSVFSNAVEMIKRARTGANLTKMEDELSEDWNPAAEGISTEDAMQRMRDLQAWLNINFATFGATQRPLGDSYYDPEYEKEGAPAPRTRSTIQAAASAPNPMDALSAEEEALYEQFPNLRPAQ
jgi:hypothetical protein